MFYKLILMVSFFSLIACTKPNSDSSNKPTPPPKPLTKTCLDGNENNQINAGLGDPFYVNSWHLKNLGKNQIVSAFGRDRRRNDANDDAVAGIDANVEAVHQNGRGCTGKGVTVAIIDSGLEIAHEDLNSNVIPNGSFNFVNLSDNPSPAPEMGNIDHGTGVAGIVASRGWNGKGTRGVAPLAKLVAFPIVQVDGLSNEKAVVADLLAFGNTPDANAANKEFNNKYTSMITAFGTKADKADVFNYSAGRNLPFPIKFTSKSALDEGFKYATQKLRDGKGAIVIQSAGNEFAGFKYQDVNINCVFGRDELAERITGLAFKNPQNLTCGSSNHEPYGKPYAYQVAAIHNNGKASSYSSAGSDIWVTGFGGENGLRKPAIITTDNMGCDSGFNNKNNTVYGETPMFAIDRMLADQKGENPNDANCNYTGRMNGTSSAAPSVSGVVALMLEANPNLTQQDVGYILAKTARKVDESIAMGDVQPVVNLGASKKLELDLPWQTNDAGFHFQNSYGFGLVDAKAAVEMAANDYQIPDGRRDTISIEKTTAATDSELDRELQIASTKLSFNDASKKTGMIRVELQLTNSSNSNLNAGYLQFELINKTGKKSILMPAFTAWFTSTDSLIKPNKFMAFRFHTNAFYGENLGAYDIKVTLVGNQSFRIDEAKLTSFSL